jgi:hypothetical protein
LQRSGAVLHYARDELRTAAVGNGFADDAQSVSGFNREIIRLQEMRITEMYVESPGAGLQDDVST